MRVIGIPVLDEFKKRHADAGAALDAWLAEVKEAKWRTPQDIKDRYSHASFLPDKRVVFNIRGNNYRLVVRVAYQTETVLVERVGTHAEYDKWKLT